MNSEVQALHKRIEILEEKIVHMCKKLNMDFLGDDKDFLVVDYDETDD